MNVLVTGAGTVGAYAGRALRERGDAVVFFDRAPDEAALAEVAGDSPVERGDVLSRADLLRALDARCIDAILHTAALLPGPESAPFDLARVNVLGTMDVLEAAREHGVGRVVHVSSTVVYYGAFPSAAPGVITEAAPVVGVSGFFYGTTKIAAELLALDYAVTGLADVVICRLGHVWGFWPGPPRSPITVLLSTIVPPLLRGETARVTDPRLHWKGREAFVHAANAGAALAAAVHAPRVNERVLNVVDEEPYAFDDFVETLGRLVPGARVEREGPPAGGYAGVPAPPPGPLSIERARAALAYSPRYDLEAGLRELVERHRRRGSDAPARTEGG